MNRSSAGKTYDFPKMEERNMEIVNLWEKGLSSREIAEKFNLSMDNVSAITRKARLRYCVDLINRINLGEQIDRELIKNLNPMVIRGIINILRSHNYTDEEIDKAFMKKEGWLVQRDRLEKNRRKKRLEERHDK